MVSFDFTVKVPALETFDVTHTDATLVRSFTVIDDATGTDVTGEVLLPLPLNTHRVASVLFTTSRSGPHTVTFACEQIAGIDEWALADGAYLTTERIETPLTEGCA